MCNPGSPQHKYRQLCAVLLKENEKMSNYLFSNPQFFEHALNFMIPVVLHRLKVFTGSVHKRRRTNNVQGRQDVTKTRPVMGLRIPTAFTITKRKHLNICRLIYSHLNAARQSY